MNDPPTLGGLLRESSAAGCSPALVKSTRGFDHSVTVTATHLDSTATSRHDGHLVHV